MLVLSRKTGQSLQIGEDIRVTIVKLDNRTVRVGIEAPRDIKVLREEVLQLGESMEKSTLTLTAAAS